MLEKTGTDLGDDQQIYSNGLVFEYCSAALSREKMKADPANIAFCPFTIQAYETPDAPGQTYVGYRRAPIIGDEESQAALQQIDGLLKGYSGRSVVLVILSSLSAGIIRPCLRTTGRRINTPR